MTLYTHKHHKPAYVKIKERREINKMTSSILAIIAGLIGLASTALGYWLWTKKREPKKPRVTYVEKEYVKAKRKLEEHAAKGNLFGLSVHASDLHDRVSTLNEMENPVKRKNTGKTSKD